MNTETAALIALTTLTSTLMVAALIYFITAIIIPDAKKRKLTDDLHDLNMAMIELGLEVDNYCAKYKGERLGTMWEITEYLRHKGLEQSIKLVEQFIKEVETDEVS